jgi:hypothetical protein
MLRSELMGFVLEKVYPAQQKADMLTLATHEKETHAKAPHITG